MRRVIAGKYAANRESDGRLNKVWLFSENFDLTALGETLTTEMFNALHSIHRTSVRPRSAAFEAAYVLTQGVGLSN